LNVTELQELIRERIDTFPTKTRRVAEYFLSHSSEVAFHSISDVADRLEVSKAQLVRVARMLGFGGYSTLKALFKQALLEQISPSSIVDVIQNADIPQNICRLEHANIDGTFKEFSPTAIVEFCEAAKKASTIYCMGWGISALVAE